jgi:hypothetical protein
MLVPTQTDTRAVTGSFDNKTSAAAGEAAASRSPYYYQLFRVKRKDGRDTTVSLDPLLIACACQHLGGLPSVRKIVREAADQFEPQASRNRSGFVAQRLRTELQRAAAEPHQALAA